MKRPGDPLRALGYVRASTEDQKLTGETQRAELAAYALARGVELVAVFEENVSGAAPLEQRGEMMRAIAMLRPERCGLLLVTKRDRLARDVIAAATLEQLAERQGARIVSIAGEGSELEGAQGKFIRIVLDAVAAYERSLISARTKAVLAHQRAQGFATKGRVPFGYCLAPDGRLLEKPSEMKIVRYCREQRAKGQTINRILELCAARGFTTRTGTKLTRTLVTRMCLRPLRITSHHQAA